MIDDNRSADQDMPPDLTPAERAVLAWYRTAGTLPHESFGLVTGLFIHYQLQQRREPCYIDNGLGSGEHPLSLNEYGCTEDDLQDRAN